MDSETKPDVSALRIDRERRAPRRGPLRAAIVAAVVTVLVAAVVIGVLLARGAPVEVEVAVAQPPASGGAVAVLNASGYVTPRRRATVAAKITGQVTDVMVEEGMPVVEGQVLARLDDSEVRARYDASRAELEVARASLADLEVNLTNQQRELERIRDLAETGVASVRDLDNAETTVASLRARLGVARQQVAAAKAQMEVLAEELENYTVRAPFSGIAVSKDAQPGEMVSPVSAGGGYTRTGISTIVDMESLEIEVDVNESHIARVQRDQPVEAVLDAYPGWRIPAHVLAVIPTADRQKATVRVRIAFDELDPRILPDMGVKVTFLETPAEAPATESVRAVIPAAAVRGTSDRPVVFVLDGDALDRRAVTLGRTLGDVVEILGGVEPGEEVVVDGPDGLGDGQAARTAG